MADPPPKLLPSSASIIVISDKFWNHAAERAGQGLCCLLVGFFYRPVDDTIGNSVAVPVITVQTSDGKLRAQQHTYTEVQQKRNTHFSFFPMKIQQNAHEKYSGFFGKTDWDWARSSTSMRLSNKRLLRAALWNQSSRINFRLSMSSKTDKADIIKELALNGQFSEIEATYGAKAAQKGRDYVRCLSWRILLSIWFKFPFLQASTKLVALRSKMSLGEDVKQQKTATAFLLFSANLDEGQVDYWESSKI